MYILHILYINKVRRNIISFIIVVDRFIYIQVDDIYHD